MKRAISALLAITFIFSAAFSLQIEANAAEEVITATAQGSYTKSSERQNITIRIETPGIAESYSTFGIYETSIPAGFEIVSFATSNTNNPIIEDDFDTTYGSLTYMATDGDTIPASTYYDVVISAPANAQGDYELTFSYVEVSKNAGKNMLAEVEAVKAVFNIAEPALVPTSDYSISYELKDNKADGDNDANPEYSVGDTVTAEVSIVSNKTDITLQAYDIYLTYDNNLSYQSQTLTSGAEFKDTSGKLAHIQAVGADTQKPISIPLTKSEAKSLGTITFKVLDSAVYDTKMPITLTVGESGEGLTNIGVGTADSGNSTSYYPQNTGTVEGVEIMNVYTVSYDANNGTWGEGANAPTQTKYHNIDLTLEAIEPTRDGYSFKGWSTESGNDNSDGIVSEYKGNAPKTFYAVWQQESFTITFVDEDGTTVLKTENGLKYGDMPTPPAVSNKENEKYTYTFTGWTPTITNVTENATYTATYEQTPRSYIITLNPDSGTYAEGYTAPSQYTYGTSEPLPTAQQISKPGYTFGGWYETDPNTIVTEVPANTYGNKTYNAKWNANTYTITFMDGEQVLATESYTPDTQSDIQALYTASKDGYTFSNWRVSETEGNWPAVGEDVAASETIKGKYGNVKLIAEWSEYEYSITYNLDGGTVTGTNPTAYGVETEPFTLINPTKTGYTFLGWTGSNGNEPQTIVAVVPGDTLGDLAYTANWQINKHTITFKDGETVVETKELEYGAAITAPADREKEGYTFKGWDPVVPSTMPDENLMFTAQWEANTYTITLNPDSGTYVDGYTPPANYTYDAVQKLPGNDDIKKPGYNLVGWYEESNPDKTVTEVAVGEIGNKTYYAKWEANTYTITFNDENDTLVKEVTFTYGDSSIEEPVVPAKNGYSGSWTAYDLTKPEDQTVKATYTLITYTIIFNTNGGTEITSVEYDITSAYTLPEATGNGNHTFNNWIVEISDNTDGWALNAEIEENTAVTGRYGNVTLKAQWDVPFTYAVEEYAYAPAGYVMLRVAASGNTNAYKFGDLEMYYTDNEFYKVEMADGTKSAGAFVTLIPKSGNVPTNADGDMTTAELTATGVNQLAETGAAAAIIARDGDVNGDTVLNVADANIVYQMRRINADYYNEIGSADQSNTLSRLEADMDPATENVDHRGSLEDVEAIVNKINGVTPTT